MMSSSEKRLSIRVEDLEASWLPDIMYLIMCKLMEFPIYLARISVVCKHWHRLVCDLWPQLVREHQITPLVLFPVGQQVSCYMYNLMGECAPGPVNSLPCGFNRIIGSSFGWLIIVSEDSYYQSISLFNPLSKLHIPLPAVHTSSWVPIKGVLSNPPPRPEEEGDQHFDIAITLRPTISWETCKTANAIAFLHVKKNGEIIESSRWKMYYKDLDYRTFNYRILDVSSIGGRIYFLNVIGMIRCYEWSSTYQDLVIYCHGVIKEWSSNVVLDGNHLASVYLVESSSSKPMVVLRYTVGFKILTFNLGDENANSIHNVLNWTEIKTLGNDAIFLSDNAGSICIQAPTKLAGSIYFCDYDDRLQRTVFGEGNVFGVFNNIDQNCLTHFSHLPNDDILSTKLLQRPPIWFLPPSYDEILKFSSIG